MEKPFNKDEQHLRELIRDVGLQKPSVNFTTKVMSSISETTENVTAKPLISARGWLVLIGIFTISSALLYFFPIENSMVSKNITASFSSYQEVMSGFEMSSEMWYACIFLSLFLLQLPFLKRFLDRQRT